MHILFYYKDYIRRRIKRKVIFIEAPDILYLFDQPFDYKSFPRNRKVQFDFSNRYPNGNEAGVLECISKSPGIKKNPTKNIAGLFKNRGNLI